MRAITAMKTLKRTLFSLFLIIAASTLFLGLQTSAAVASDLAVVQSVTLSGNGSATRVEIEADKPMTYTYYALKNPSRTVIDLSQAELGSITVPTPEGESVIKSIDVTKNELTVGSLVRVSLEMDSELDLVVIPDPLQPNKLIITVANTVQETVEQPAAATPAIASAAPAAPSKPNPLQNVLESISVEGSTVLVKTSKAVDKYRYFTMSNPDRLVVDLYNVKQSLASNSIQINELDIATARIGSYPEKIRIVFDAKASPFPSFTIQKSDTGVTIAVAQASPAAPSHAAQPSAESKPEQTAHEVKAKEPEIAAVEAIDFSLQGEYSRIQVKTNKKCAVVGPVKTAEGLMVTFSDCRLPKNLQRPFETNAFESSVLRFTPYQVRAKGATDTKINIVLREDSEFTVKSDETTHIVDIRNPAEQKIQPVKAAAQSVPTVQSVAVVQAATAADRSGRKVYTGKRVTLEFADADVRKIFQLIAEVSNLNILVGDDVTGTISIKLVNVPWDQALDVILETKGLGMKQDGNIAVIRPKDKIVSLADEALAAKKAYERTLDIRTRIFDVNHASVTDMAGQFASYKSESGTITVDNRTNRVIVNDVEPSIAKMESLLRELDMPEKQVLIEARIVEASSNFTQDLGVQWGIHYRDKGGLMKSLDTHFGGVVTNIASESFLPAATAYGGALGMTFGRLADNLQIDLRLSAAAETGQVKIISTPKVVTLNNKAAKISQGQMIPYPTLSAEGTKTEFIEAALTLEVTPHITADGSVSMKIKASNNSVGSAGSGDVPPINKKEATTELLVKSGQTTVIGGIYVDTETENTKGVPGLKNIPLLGWLFKSNSKLKTKSELLIFITPRIVN